MTGFLRVYDEDGFLQKIPINDLTIDSLAEIGVFKNEPADYTVIDPVYDSTMNLPRKYETHNNTFYLDKPTAKPDKSKDKTHHSTKIKNLHRKNRERRDYKHVGLEEVSNTVDIVIDQDKFDALQENEERERLNIINMQRDYIRYVEFTKLQQITTLNDA